MPRPIIYRDGYKYQLVRDYRISVGIMPEKRIDERFLCLHPWGELVILAGYSWDGPSGPAVDTRNFMRGSLIHDALYQLLRSGELEPQHRITADKLLREICIEDGMSKLRAWWVYRGVRLGASKAAHVTRPTMTAP